MDLNGIPNFFAIAVVVVLSFPLLRLNGQVRLRYWFAGWLTILFHAFLIIVDPGTADAATTRTFWQYTADAATDTSLCVASIFFICATGVPRRRSWYLPLLVALPNIVAIVCWDVQIGSPRVLSYVLMAMGAATIIWGLHHGIFPCSCSLTAASVATAAAYLLEALLFSSGSTDLAASWLLCWPYLAVAYLFWNNSPKLTTGLVVTSTSFVAWGLVFPAGWLLYRFWPDVKIETEIWNIPKFLAISGMILTLLEQQLENMKSLAMNDSLTGLPNRRAYSQRLREALLRADRSGKKVAVLSIDLNGLKSINDAMGHAAGDETLRQVAGRLGGTIRNVDMLARIGGDEFAVIVEGLRDFDSARKIVQSLRNSLREPVPVLGKDLATSASIGFALYPDDARDHEDLHALADQRMYLAKSANREQFSTSPQAGTTPVEA